MEIVKWDDYEGCPMGSKKWGRFVDGAFEDHGSYQKGDFPIVWCEHDCCACSAVYGQDSCVIYCDHRDEWLKEPC